MDSQVMHEKSKKRDCVYEEPLEPCALVNENVIFHSKDSGTPTAAGKEGNTKASALCPITPTPCRENGDAVFVTSTPLSLESPQSPKVDGFNSTSNKEVVDLGLDGSPRTPDEGVFDPFAPGPDKMLLAPVCRKLLKESQKIVARRLNFDDDSDDFPTSNKNEDNKNEDALSEKLLLDSFYGTLLEAIILKQSEEFLAENHPLESGSLHTPPSPPPLLGVADTCPGAPVKAAAGKSRNIVPGLCRKLEF
ncbi:uncharacterized protein LOC104895188 [Beta vulgaris subsp. vulgaris]|uniref:uncharacterized protein LOC104895188 n=1 Tax=Beta vulgaris subsp. vulgaris TaxID=3555 RepID=UPI002036DDB0|nr:uncharacterized protein LOC104895188 [Beta vulgaris subsp. vulgaris]XP_010679928.2 uncharacterized protein LOC104895188 [Beta vulgaris subsp. vulgaris]